MSNESTHAEAIADCIEQCAGRIGSISGAIQDIAELGIMGAIDLPSAVSVLEAVRSMALEADRLAEKIEMETRSAAAQQRKPTGEYIHLKTGGTKQ